jgi:uncharacterized protein (TIGR00645 family)
MLRKIEHWVEVLVFASRWVLAPFYIGLALSLVVLLISFVKEFLHLAEGAFVLGESDVILGVLALVDLSLTGSLLVIVIFSGYENFVSKIDHSGHRDWPEWMGTIDFSALKLKLLSSIVAISAIQLLKQFMSIKTVTPESERTLMWLVIIHLVFVTSSVLLALSDRIAGHGDGGYGAPSAGGHGGSGHSVKADATHPAPTHNPARQQVAAAPPKTEPGKGGKGK